VSLVTKKNKKDFNIVSRSEICRLVEILLTEETNAFGRANEVSKPSKYDWIRSFRNEQALQNAAGDIWQYVAGPQLEVAQCELIALEGDILRLQLEKLQLKEKKDAKHN